MSMSILISGESHPQDGRNIIHKTCPLDTRKNYWTWMPVLLGLSILHASLSAKADWIFFSEEPSGSSKFLIEINDKIISNGPLREFKYRITEIPDRANKSSSQVIIDYIAHCNKSVIIGEKMTAIINGRAVEGPPSGDEIIIPNERFNSIYKYACTN